MVRATRLVSAAAAGAIVSALGVGCAGLIDLEDVDFSTPIDAATERRDGPIDSPVTKETSTDAPPSACPDATVLAGNGSVDGLATDATNTYEMDFYPLKVGSETKAGCVFLYVQSAPRSKQVLVGLYSNDVGAPNPVNLVASATMTVTNVPGWNSVSIAPQTLNAGSTVWVGVSPFQVDDTGDKMETKHRETGCVAPGLRSGPNMNGLPPDIDPAKLTKYDFYCDLAMYLAK